MGHNDDGEAETLAQVRKQVDDLRPHRNIQCGKRLVANQDGRVKCKGAGNGYALALSTGKRTWQPVQHRCWQGNQIKQFPHAGPAFAGSAQPVNLQRLFQGLRNSLAAAHRAQWVLEDKLHGTGETFAVRLLPCRAITTIDQHFSSRRGLQANNGAGQGGFAATRFTNNAVKGSWRNRKVNTIDRANGTRVGAKVNLKA